MSKQEPVAWMYIENYLDEDNLWDSRKILRDYDNGLGVPLYTSPQRREWQGLTLGDLMGILNKDADETDLDIARAIEAKLKEKNCAT